MSIIRKTITVTEQQEQWIKSRIASGQYTNDSEYMRELLRRDQEDNDTFLALKKAIQDGLDRGVSERSAEEILQSVLDRRSKK
ncbi:MAG: type II toxin-antitoxin system ParD family antitoxin [Bacteroidota bacterium]